MSSLNDSINVRLATAIVATGISVPVNASHIASKPAITLSIPSSPATLETRFEVVETATLQNLYTQMETLTQRVSELETLMDADVYLSQPAAMPETQSFISARAIHAAELSQPRPLDPDFED
jgi:hypothetical protein